MNYFTWGINLENNNQLSPPYAYNRLCAQLSQSTDLKECQCKLDNHVDFVEILLTHDIELIYSILRKPFVWEEKKTPVSAISSFIVDINCMILFDPDGLRYIKAWIKKRMKCNQSDQSRLIQELARTNDKLNVIASEMDSLRQCFPRYGIRTLHEDKIVQEILCSQISHEDHDEKEWIVFGRGKAYAYFVQETSAREFHTELRSMLEYDDNEALIVTQLCDLT